MHVKIQQILDTTKTRIRAFGPEIRLGGMPECMQRRDFLSAVAVARAEATGMPYSTVHVPRLSAAFPRPLF